MRETVVMSKAKVRQIKLVGELYNYRLVDSVLVFDCLYQWLGHKLQQWSLVVVRCTCVYICIFTHVYMHMCICVLYTHFTCMDRCDQVHRLWRPDLPSSRPVHHRGDLGSVFGCGQ